MSLNGGDRTETEETRGDIDRDIGVYRLCFVGPPSLTSSQRVNVNSRVKISK